MAKKSKFNYFDAFEKQVEIALDETEVLITAIENFAGAEKLKPLLEQAHDHEKHGDDVNHQILTSVAADFITPIEREDIIELAQALDDIIDMIESILQRFYMFDIQFMHPQAIEFAHIIKKELKALRKSMDSFRELKKVKKIRATVEDVNQLEEQADALYLDTIRNLYTIDIQSADLRVDVWSRLFDSFEAVCDAGENVADTMASIMLKNV